MERVGARGGGWKVEINLNVLNKGRQNIDSLYSVEEGISILCRYSIKIYKRQWMN